MIGFDQTREKNIGKNVCDSNGKKFLPLYKEFTATKHSFKSHDIKVPNYTPDVKERCTILFTFGKDSLLSYALAEELGLSREDMNDIIIALKEKGFIIASLVGNRALLRITSDGITLLKNNSARR